ncbi:hypothetical protein FV218_06595 [Methylobacterium sp. WL69]|uniref:hypothetical protein n=1 Tax=Methylobacterium sp. WL69 TaxID=2603893 RepID=UPI0011CC0451|nr:hypothetical protein [Methylobacterium sp. WL69]TXM76607.1 hypothetical protein FV218_06595 [Methylobacterium sp. WL69]
MRELIDMVDFEKMQPNRLRELIDTIDIDRAKPEMMREIILSLSAPIPTMRSAMELAAQYGDEHADEIERLEAGKLAAQADKLRADAQAARQRAGIKRIS